MKTLILFAAFATAYLAAPFACTYAQPIWEELDGPYTAPIRRVFVTPDGKLTTIVSILPTSSVYFSLDGLQWQHSGYKSYYFSVDLMGRWYDFDKDVWSSDNGNTWNPLNSKAYFGLLRIGSIDTNADVFYVSRNNELFGGQGIKGVFRSTNMGATWESLQPFEDHWYCYSSMLVSQKGTYCNGVRRGDSVGVCRSSDDGATWETVFKWETDENTPKLYLTEDTRGYLYALFYPVQTKSVILRSTDDGRTWNRWAVNRPDARELVHLASGITIARADTGLFKTVNDGATWQSTQGELSDYPMTSIVKQNDSVVFVSTGNGVWRTDDAGSHWRRVNRGFREFHPGFHLIADSTGAVYAGAEVLWRSRDNGKTWEEAGPFPHQYASGGQESMKTVNALTVAPDNTLYAGIIWDTVVQQYTGVTRSRDGGMTWERFTIIPDIMQRPINPITLVTSLAASKRGSIFAVWGADKDTAWVSRDDGANWTFVSPLSGYEPSRFYRDNNDRLYLLYTNESNSNDLRLYSSIDDGYSWNYTGTGNRISCIGPHNELYAYGSPGLGLLSTDCGGQWNTLSLPPCTGGVSLTNQNGDLFTFCAQGGVHSIYKSTDGGQTWADFSSGLKDKEPYYSGFGNFKGFTIDRNGYMYVATDNYVYQTRESTVPCSAEFAIAPNAQIVFNWDEVIEVPVYTTHSFGQRPDSPTIFGIRYDDTLLEFLEARQAAADETTESLDTNAVAGGINIAARGLRPVAGETVFTLRFRMRSQPLKPTTVMFSFTVDSLSDCPTTFSAPVFTVLVDGRCDKIVRRKPGLPPPVVYPNPLRSTAEAAFTLIRAGQVHLGLYDAYGRELRVIAAGEFDAGTHRITLDGNSLPSGSHYLRLTAPEGTAGRRVVVEK